MNLKTLFYGFSAIAVLLTLGCGLVFNYASRTHDDATAMATLSSDILEAGFRLQALTNDCRTRPAERTHRQWTTTHEGLSVMLARGIQRFRLIRSHLRLMASRSDRAWRLFDRLRESCTGPTGLVRNQPTPQRDALIDQLSTYARSIASQAAQIRSIANRELKKADRLSTAANHTILFVIFIAAMFALVIFRMRIIEPIRKIGRSVRFIADGDFNHSIRLGRKDELGDIAATLNHLSTSLGETLVSRDELADEVGRRRELESIVNRSPAIAFLWRNEEGWPVAYVSENVSTWGYEPSEFADGRIKYRDLIHPEDRQRTAEEVSEQIRIGAEGFDQEYRIVTRDHDAKWVSDHTWIRRDETGDIVFIQGVVLDISRRKAFEGQVEKLAYYDPLTNLPNRLLFRDRLDQSVMRARREGVRFAVLFLDLDHFKHVNDSLGHPTGDKLLFQAAARLAGLVRATDTVARLGGDEFAILQTGVRNPRDAAILAEKVIESLAAPFEIDGYDIRTGTSVGITMAEHGVEGPVKIMEEADIALYRVKERERGNFAFHTEEMSAVVREEVHLGQDLKMALESDDQLHLVYQPQIDLANGRLIGVEALIRWNHPTRGAVSPLQFIPVAEERGLIPAIGDFVVRESCRQARRWLDELGEGIKVAINVAVPQFTDPMFVEKIREALEAEDLPPHLLEIEITETLFMKSADVVVGIMNKIVDMGVSMSIDDFGTGFSSLLYLKKLPVYKIKVAQEFVREMLESSSDAEIVRATIVLAHNLGLRTLAEGVETEAELRFLSVVGCEEVQGYFYSRPLLADAVLDYAREKLAEA